jgi:hypothetical protein
MDPARQVVNDAASKVWDVAWDLRWSESMRSGQCSDKRDEWWCPPAPREGLCHANDFSPRRSQEERDTAKEHAHA